LAAGYQRALKVYFFELIVNPDSRGAATQDVRCRFFHLADVLSGPSNVG
jgi:hypothetical protein